MRRGLSGHLATVRTGRNLKYGHIGTSMKTLSKDAAGEAIGRAVAASDDFGHEMRVRAMLKKHGAHVQHGWTYADPVEGKPRQFDFRATLMKADHAQAVRLAVEAKNLAVESPLIVSGTARVPEEAFHDRVKYQNRNGHDFVGVLRSKADQPFYPVGKFVGKSILRLKWDEKRGFVSSAPLESEIYNRWTQALASADELCKSAAISTTRRPELETVIMPLVVVPDGTLWIIEYDAEGRQVGRPELSDATNLFLNHEVVVRPHNNWMNLSHVNFYTLTGLDVFLGGLVKNDAWGDWFISTAVAHTPPVH